MPKQWRLTARAAGKGVVAVQQCSMSIHTAGVNNVSVDRAAWIYGRHLSPKVPRPSKIQDVTKKLTKTLSHLISEEHNISQESKIVDWIYSFVEFQTCMSTFVCVPHELWWSKYASDASQDMFISSKHSIYLCGFDCRLK